MYKKFKGGTSIKIQEDDLQVEVNIPPVGYGYKEGTNELVKTDVLQRSNIKEDQYWERPPAPQDYGMKRAKERMKQEQDADYFDPELQEYAQQEWHRRLHGVWFMNNGKPIYLTGLNYFYLTHWQIDIGHPRFRWIDTEYFYFVAYCMEDPNCYGFTEVTRRRQGKTFRAGCWLAERITRKRSANGGIQSKTLEDAKKEVFLKAVVYPFKKLPDFFKPVYNTDKGDTPSSSLEFRKPSRRGKFKYVYQEGEELESEVDYRNSGEKAYDGRKLIAYVCDEAAKAKDVAIWERHMTNKFCLEEDGVPVGKAIYTTTVEEMESGGAEFKILWENSDQTKKTLGQTVSGLYRYFCPAYRTAYRGVKEDKYGYLDEEKVKEIHIQIRKSYESSPRTLASYVRKNPFTWKEAFRVDGDKCLYNSEVLNNRLSSLTWMKRMPYVRGNFIWEDPDEKTKVKFVKDNQSGRFYLTTELDETRANKVKRAGNYWLPQNTTDFVAGIDPYDHDVVKDEKRASKGSGHVYWKYSALDDIRSENFICRYNSRPPKPSIFYEDMVKMCHYFGCKMLFENNKPGIKKHFIDRGYSEFFVRDEKGNIGIAGSQKAHMEIAEVTEEFIEDNGNRVMFPELLEDWLEFDINNTQKFDDAMSSGYALIAAKQMQRRMKKISEVKAKPKDLVRTYSLR